MENGEAGLREKNSFDSEYCSVRFMEEDRVVLLTWKKFCRLEDYRKPTMFAAGLLQRNRNSNLVIDARNGFEDDKSDVEWGFSVLLPAMAESDCKFCIFIMKEITQIEEEIDLWTREFMKYFEVRRAPSYEAAVEFLKNV